MKKLMCLHSGISQNANFTYRLPSNKWWCLPTLLKHTNEPLIDTQSIWHICTIRVLSYRVPNGCVQWWRNRVDEQTLPVELDRPDVTSEMIEERSFSLFDLIPKLRYSVFEPERDEWVVDENYFEFHR